MYHTMIKRKRSIRMDNEPNLLQLLHKKHLEAMTESYRIKNKNEMKKIGATFPYIYGTTK